MVSSPKAPDPVQTAQTQQSMNTNTALTQQAVNMVNQNTPDGSLTYSQSGNSFIPDQNGQTYYKDPQGKYHTSLPPASTTSSTAAGKYVTQRGAHGDTTQVWVPGKTTTSSSTPEGWSTVKGSYIPQYTATTTLSPQQQAIADQSNAAKLGLSKLANEQTAAISTQLSKPFSYDQQLPGDFKYDEQLPGAFSSSSKMPDAFKYTGSDAEDMAYRLGAKRLDPQFAQSQDALRSQLIASGLRPGSEAYNEQMQQFGRTKNDAYDQLTLGAQQQGYGQALSSYQAALAAQQQGYGQDLSSYQTQLARQQQGFGQSLSGYQQQLARQQQGYQQALTTYNEPINSITALMSGSQVQNPTFAQTPTANVGGVNYTGLVDNQYQAQVSAANATNGGLFGLLSAPFQAMKFSDIRLKSDIRRVGVLDNGLPVYSYRFGDGPTEIGLIAQEVEQVRPSAVSVHPSGFKMVDYGKASV